MDLIKKIIRTTKTILGDGQKVLPIETFYTKDYFKNQKFIIGDFTYGKPYVRFENVEANLIIGKYCSIADEVTIFLGGNHRIDWITTYPFNSIPDKHYEDFKTIVGHPATKGDVVIGNDVWLGLKSVILSGVTIGDGAVVAAGSVVTKNIGSYEIWGGNPAQFIKKRFSDQQISKLLELKWWEWEEQKIRKNIELLCSENVEDLITNEV